MVGNRHLSPALSSQRPRPILFLLDHGIRPQHLAQHVHPADRRQERRTLCQRHPWHALLGRQKTPPGPEHCSRSNDRRVPHRRRRPHTLIYKPRTGPQGPSDTHRAYIRETRRPPIAPAISSSRTTIPLPMADQGRSPLDIHSQVIKDTSGAGQSVFTVIATDAYLEGKARDDERVRLHVILIPGR